jgi:hypothetical protein
MVSGQIGVKDMTFFKTLWCDQSGASAAEYALILAIVGTGIQSWWGDQRRHVQGNQLHFQRQHKWCLLS